MEKQLRCTKQSRKHPFDVLKLFFFQNQIFYNVQKSNVFAILFSHVIRHSFIVFKVKYDLLLAQEVFTAVIIDMDIQQNYHFRKD